MDVNVFAIDKSFPCGAHKGIVEHPIICPYWPHVGMLTREDGIRLKELKVVGSQGSIHLVLLDMEVGCSQFSTNY